MVVHIGATCVGGGAVTFPVMALLLRITPRVASDFAMMIQSCGMAASAFTIVYMRVKIIPQAVILNTIGAAVGIVIGLQFLHELFTRE